MACYQKHFHLSRCHMFRVTFRSHQIANESTNKQANKPHFLTFHHCLPPLSVYLQVGKHPASPLQLASSELNLNLSQIHSCTRSHCLTTCHSQPLPQPPQPFQKDSKAPAPPIDAWHVERPKISCAFVNIPHNVCCLNADPSTMLWSEHCASCLSGAITQRQAHIGKCS